jgi:hypothetical protein
MGELLCHLAGDFWLQNHWMATRKTSSSRAAAIHALFYTLPFLFLTWNPLAIAIITGTHFAIDRFRLARYWAAFWGIGQASWLQRKMGQTVSATPDFLAVWLLIITDNTIHLTINHFALML